MCSGGRVARSILLRMIQWEIWSCIPCQPCVRSLSRSIILTTAQDEIASFPKRRNHVIFAPLFFSVRNTNYFVPDGSCLEDQWLFLAQLWIKGMLLLRNGMYVRVHGDLNGLLRNMCAYLPDASGTPLQ